MNRERAEELLPIIEAYANGEEIEFKNRKTDGRWIVAAYPDFYDDTEYRIKPKPLECWVALTDNKILCAYRTEHDAFNYLASYIGNPARIVRMVEQPEDGQNN